VTAGQLIQFSPLLTKEQLAAHWQVSERWIELRVKNDGLPHKRLGRAIRFRLEDCERWLERRNEAA
jgi:excisionase family DNA binding protein